MTRLLFFLISLFVGIQTSAAASKAPLFQKGPETFKIVDSKSKPAKFRVLEDSVTKQSLAVALNSLLKKSKEVKPYVDLTLEKITLSPLKENPEEVQMTMLISGRSFDIEPTVKKADLKNGKTVKVNMPAATKEVGLFTVTSKGHFSLRYSAQQNVLFIDNALAHIEIENPMTAEEEEKITFSGKWFRQ